MFPYKIPRAPVYCFHIRTSNTKKAIHSNSSLEHVVVYFVFSLESDQVKKKQKLVIFHETQNHFPPKRDQVDFSYESHEQQFSTFGGSFVIKVLRSRKLTFASRIVSAKNHCTANFLN